MNRVTHLQAEKSKQAVRKIKDRETMGMHAIVNKIVPLDQRPSREEAEDAVRVLLRWAGDDPQRPPLALRLDYKRNIPGKTIAEASVKEMRRFVSDEALLRQWGEQMQRIFPDVKPGDHILGVYRPDGARFYQDDRLIGAIGVPGFAEAFFGIWLDARTSAPDLRMALLRRPGA